jgi:hypothetical protein
VIDITTSMPASRLLTLRFASTLRRPVFRYHCIVRVFNLRVCFSNDLWALVAVRLCDHHRLNINFSCDDKLRLLSFDICLDL